MWRNFTTFECLIQLLFFLIDCEPFRSKSKCITEGKPATRRQEPIQRPEIHYQESDVAPTYI